MIPYFKSGSVTLYLGDCREIIPSMPPVEMILTDPPYPDLKGGYEFVNGGVAKQNAQSVSVGDAWVASFDWLDLASNTGAKPLILFTTYHSIGELLNRLPGQVVLIGGWHKPNAHPGNPASPKYSVELYVGSRLQKGANWRGISDHIVCTQDFGGCISRGERIRNADGSNAHPTQKPLEVMEQLIPRGCKSILDPFAGTGTTLLAAWRNDCEVVGIEREEKYCEIAARRLERELSQGKLFKPERAEPARQLALV